MADDGDPDFDYAKISDEEAEYIRPGVINDKGFFLYPSELFENVVKTADTDENLNETVKAVFDDFNRSVKGQFSERDFSGLFDDVDLNSNKLGATIGDRNKRLAKILKNIAAMDLGSFEENSIDAFGDAYEYLMSLYASSAGKSGGEYYTPQEVSELLTLIATSGKEKVSKVYDPACGSGSLLLKSARILGKDNIQNGFYGQEVNPTTYNLCRINMILHDVGPDNFDIALGDTLTRPFHWDDEPFDVIVSNPPYSLKWEGEDNPELTDDERYSPAGVLAPKAKADYAFVMHCLHWLSEDGKAAIVSYPGALYRKGAEQKIRKFLVDNNYLEAIIRLPKNLFFGTSTETAIMVLKKGKQDNDVLFIDAFNDYHKVINNNKLEPEHIRKIIETFTARENIDSYSRIVSKDEIAEKDYNLLVPTYIEPEVAEEKINLKELLSDYKNNSEEIQINQNRLFDLLSQLDSKMRD